MLIDEHQRVPSVWDAVERLVDRIVERDLPEAGCALRRERFGEYGVSVYAAPDAGSIDDVARTFLRTHRWLTITTVGDLRRAGLEILPTFRRPHCTVMLRDLHADVDRLLGCQTVVAVNPHAETLEDEP